MRQFRSPVNFENENTVASFDRSASCPNSPHSATPAASELFCGGRFRSAPRMATLRALKNQIRTLPMKTLTILVWLCLGVLSAHAQLAVTVTPPKITGQKAIVSLAMTNYLAESVESARAICFLLDEQGKLVGQSANWVIGGTKDRPGLIPKTGTTYNFVITSPHLFTTTNLTAKISFSRVILDGGKLADVMKSVTLTNQK
jgi:hypothetical protein